ncbi:MAG: trigger factor [Candidatus Gracilibacteria bacterium]|nr:trigger factor [Candidatus Gracilibacteria bacterium]
MNSQVKKLEKSIVEITIEESVENIAKYRNKAIKKIEENADIKGFRKGANIPDEVIVKQYGEAAILNSTIDEALNVIYNQALRENNIIPVSQGELKEIVSQSPLKVIMHVEVLPEVEVDAKYKKIKLEKTKFDVTDAEVKSNLDQIQTKFTKFEEAQKDYEAQNGDKVYINTQGYNLKSKELENTKMENYPLVLGSNLLVPGFEEGIVGNKVGENLELKIEFPEDYHNKDFKGKKTKFSVEILKIERSIKPEFTQEFIKDLRGKDLDFEGFKDLVKSEILETKEMNARMEDENKLMEELAKISKVDFGESLLKNQISKVYAEIKENITQSGAKVDDYISSLGMNEETYIEKNVKPVAEKRLTAELILNKLAEIEKIEASEDEINKEIEKIVERFGSQEVVERLKQLYVPGTKYYVELAQRISYRKLIDSFFN